METRAHFFRKGQNKAEKGQKNRKRAKMHKTYKK